jgi:hypothetical protein
MKTPGLEHIILLIALIALPLLNWLFQRAKRQFEAEPPEGESGPGMAQGAQAIPQQLRKPRMPRDRLHKIEAPVVSTSLPRRISATELTLGNRQEIRRGIVLMAVLGPCRAFDPPDWNR